MKVTEIASLLGKGYKVEEIKELASISATTPEALEMAKTGAKVSDIKELIALADAGDTTPGTPSPDPEPVHDDPTPDYKAMYEELKQQSDELKATVSKLQNDNTHRNNGGSFDAKEPSDILGEIMKDFT